MARTFDGSPEELAEYVECRRRLREERVPVAVAGCSDSQRVHLACELAMGKELLLLLTYNEVRAKELYEDAACFSRGPVYLYPSKDLLFFQADVRGMLLTARRMEVLRRILESGCGTIVASVDGCMDRITSPGKLTRSILELVQGDEADIAGLAARLTAMGYERCAQVESVGQFSVRGGILDVYALAEENPVRIEFWGDEIDSIRSFDVETQRSLENLEFARIYPASECFEDDGFLLQYFSADDIVALDEPEHVAEKAAAVAAEFDESMRQRLEKGLQTADELPTLLPPEKLWGRLSRGRVLLLTTFEYRGIPVRTASRYNIQARTIHSYGSNFELMLQDMARWKRDNYRVALLCGSRSRAERIAANLREYDISAFFAEDAARRPQPGQVLVTYGNIHKSFEYPMLRMVIVSEGDLFGKVQRKRRKRTSYSGKRVQSFRELSVGDYVIHENHGLGIYKGIEKKIVGDIEKDYMKIMYGDGGNLYVPVTQMNMIQKYAESDAEKVPKLNRLGGAEWHKTKTRVRKAVGEIAEDLVRLYSHRQSSEGYAFSEDTPWQVEFEEQFPFEETDDQLQAIEAVKQDMQSSRIMDRLICGDVGFGKTEIAIRAAFKAVQDGKQVIFLAPTTILAQQHYNTFVQRMKEYPVYVGLLCRFRTPAEQKKLIEEIKRGLADIVIGTHRVLSKDVVFKNPGLLIIDEEQRFGVSDKEKIKKLRENIDVLSLTATPIPRTLHMSLIGIRDMSVLEEPPLDRVAIQTYVAEYNDEIVREAVQRELSRGGQVYYVYNKVKDIADIAARISMLVPDASVAYAHGQMKERELEHMMLDFVNGEVDVLVSTTIIETGLDISNVNTIIIHDADRFGLSQLYQLRGRVGRSNRTAYAFLLYKGGRLLKEVAEKRLAAIREYTELGSGIRIAMRDLELRGAGNLLGAEQHGHMEAVGYDLYCKMLQTAVSALQGEKAELSFDTTIDMDVDAYIPDSYIQNENRKMDVYRRIASVETEEDYREMQDELIDRFGDIPRPVQTLLRIARIRSLAHEACVTELTASRKQVQLIFLPQAPMNPEKVVAFAAGFRGALRVQAGEAPQFTLQYRPDQITSSEQLTESVKSLLIQINDLR